MFSIMFLFTSLLVSDQEQLTIHPYLPINVPWSSYNGEIVSMHFILPIAAFLAFCFVCWELFSDKKRVRRWFSNHLIGIASLILFAGFLLYFIGYSQKIDGDNEWYIVILSTIQAGGRALISSLGMFFFETDFIEVGEVYHHNLLYLVAFAIVHLGGILISTHVILRLLGERLLSNRRMTHILLNPSKRDFFVFWGINEESITLAASITDKYTKEGRKKNLELIFVETPSEKELEIREHSISHFFNSSLHGSSMNDRIEEMGGTILYPKRRLIDVDKEILESKSTDNHFNKLGLNSLSELCEKSSNIKFFLFSDDQKKNIQDTLILRDFFERKMRPTHDEIHLYPRARRNDVNMILEELNYLKGKNKIKVHIIDDANLAILSLKMKPEYHPVQYVSVKKNAQVSSEFNALILGFGQTGRDAFRFLYEFGTFTGDSDKNEICSPLKITAIDKDMENLKGIFLSKAPALRTQFNKERTDYKSFDITSESFWKGFLISDDDNSTEKYYIRKLNYIVIALGDDKTNLSIAMDLYKLILRYKLPDGPKFTIFVRLYEKDVIRESNLIHEYTMSDNENRIVFFGNPEELYTYDIIINDKVLREAQIFAYIYKKGAKALKTWSNENEKEAEAEWKSKLNSVTKDGLLDIKRQIEQDMSNSWHVQTKIHLIRKAGIIDEARDSWPGNRGEEQKFENVSEYISPVKYNVPKNEQEIIDNIAICEHLRWNALSELQGYISYESDSEGNHKNHFKKELSCLRPWKPADDANGQKQELHTNNIPTLFGNKELRKTMKFDYNALDTSIYMNKNGM